MISVSQGKAGLEKLSIRVCIDPIIENLPANSGDVRDTGSIPG